jgi:N-acetylglucosamine-6-phosphate deacetylase
MPGARLLGAHLEGPYLSPSRPGAQAPELIRPADPDELAGWLATGVVRLITIAPEVPANRAIIGTCRAAGVVVSAGHTDATFDDLVAAVGLGVSHVTHTFNAMRPLHHREPGVVGAAMTLDELTVELIADGVHVHPAAMRALLAARGVDGVVLVPDAIRAAGLPDGEHPLGERTVTVGDGAVRLADGTLAGSVLTMDRGLANLRTASGRDLAALWPTASRNAARIAGVGDRTGVLAAGRDADLVLVDDEVAVHTTIVAGHVVHRA